MRKRDVRITFRLGGREPTTIPVAHGPREGEDLGAFITRIAKHAGVAWDAATVTLPGGERQEVRRDTRDR